MDDVAAVTEPAPASTPGAAAVLDREEVDLLARTARDAFGASIDGPALGELGWLGLVADESAGGAGWHPGALAAIVEAAAGERTSFDLIAPNLAARALASIVDHERPEAPAHRDRLDDVLAGRCGAAIVVDPALAVSDATPPLVRGTATCLLAGPADPAVVVVVGAAPGAVLVLDTAQGETTVERFDHGAELGRPQLGVHDTERPTASIAFAGAPATIAPGLDAGAFLDLARVLACADTVGTFALANRTIREYLVDRSAFGVRLASFQALQHRLVDLSLFEVAARAITVDALRSLAGGGPGARASALAHAYVHGRATEALDECVQLAGGIGFTWEHPLHHSLRRAFVNRSRFGSVRDAEDLVAAVEGWRT